MDELYMRFPGGKTKAFTLSYDDNVTQDEKFIKLMEKYQLKGTFNIIPGWFSPEGKEYPADETYINVTEKKALEIYNSPYIEVANHGYTHKKMKSLPGVMQMEEIVKCRIALENMYHKIIRGYAYPYGWYDQKSMDILKNAEITYARTVNSTHQFYLPENWLELNPTCHHADPELMNLTETFVSKIVNDFPIMFYVWGHTFEFDQQNNWEIIEPFFEKISGREDIWYATNGEIYEYQKAFESLICSADGKRVYNPTTVDVYVKIDTIDYIIPAGEEKIFEI